MEPPTKKHCQKCSCDCVDGSMLALQNPHCKKGDCPCHRSPDAMEGDDWEKLYEKFNNETFETTLERWGLNQGQRLILRAFIDSQFISKAAYKASIDLHSMELKCAWEHGAQQQKAAILSVIEEKQQDNKQFLGLGYSDMILADLATRIQSL